VQRNVGHALIVLLVASCSGSSGNVASTMTPDAGPELTVDAAGSVRDGAPTVDAAGPADGSRSPDGGDASIGTGDGQTPDAAAADGRTADGFAADAAPDVASDAAPDVASDAAPDLAAADSRTADGPGADAAPMGPCVPQPVAVTGWQALPTRSPQDAVFVADPLALDVAYAISAGKWLLTTADAGRTWCHLATPGDARAVWVAPGATNVLYLLTGPAGPTAAAFFRSGDRGRSWAMLPKNPFSTLGFTETARRLVIHPRDPDTAYVLDETLAKTSDGGRSFRTLGDSSDFNRPDGLVIDPHTPEHVFVWRPGAGLYDVLMRSLDGGATWIGAGNAPAFFSSHISPIPELAVDNTSRLLLREAAGFMSQSTDDGATWTRPAVFGKGRPFAFVGSAPGTLYTVLGDAPSIRFIKTIDGDQTWNQISEVQGTARLLGAGPGEGSFFVESRIGVVRTLDEGRSWNLTAPNVNGPSGSIFVVSHAAAGTLYLGKAAGILRSTDGGQTFTGGVTRAPVSGMNLVALAADPADASTVYASWRSGGTTESAFKSTDGGLTWTAWPIQAPGDAGDTGFHALAAAPGSPGTFYAALSGGVRRTTDGGRTWTNVLGGAVLWLAVAPSNGQIVFVKLALPDVPGLAGIKRSMDGGTSWADVSLGAVGMASQVRDIAIHPTDPMTVYVASDSAFSAARSTDGGKTWISLDPGFGDNRPLTVSISISRSRPSTIYAAGFSGIYRSDDGGTGWTRIDKPPITNDGLLSVFADPVDPRTAYSQSQPLGRDFHLYRTTTGGD
jgi:photosystem II stability/assembly factor-like uncharacterized protein